MVLKASLTLCIKFKWKTFDIQISKSALAGSGHICATGRSADFMIIHKETGLYT